MISLIEGCTASNREVITEVLRSQPRTGKPLRNICVTNNYRYVPFVVIIIQFFPHLLLMTEFTTRRVAHVEQKLLILPERLRLPPVLSEIRVARCLEFCVMFCISWLVLFLLVWHCVSFCDLWLVTTSFGIFRLFLHFASQGWCMIFINVKHDIWREKSLINSISDKENILLCD
jgi:hypothetical protein